jgi:hypothetical protein
MKVFYGTVYRFSREPVLDAKMGRDYAFLAYVKQLLGHSRCKVERVHKYCAGGLLHGLDKLIRTCTIRSSNAFRSGIFGASNVLDQLILSISVATIPNPKRH